MNNLLKTTAVTLGLSLGVPACGEKPENHGVAITVVHETVEGIEKKAIAIIDKNGKVVCTAGLSEFPVTGTINRDENHFQQTDGNPLWQEGVHVGDIHRTQDKRYTEIFSIGGNAILRSINRDGSGTDFFENEKQLQEGKRNCEDNKQ